MKETSGLPFGLIIAYLLPGFIGLAGLASRSPAVAAWLQPVNQGEAGLGPAVYAVLAALTIGMVVSCVRWLVVDRLHRWGGVEPAVWDDGALNDSLAAFNYLVESHYRYYQFYGNSLVALVWSYGLLRSAGSVRMLGLGTDLGVFILCLVLFAGSRDALAKYHRRTSRLFGVVAEKGSRAGAMTNGNHHAQEAGGAAKPRPPVNDGDKPAAQPKPKPVEVRDGKPAK